MQSHRTWAWCRQQYLHTLHFYFCICSVYPSWHVFWEECSDSCEFALSDAAQCITTSTEWHINHWLQWKANRFRGIEFEPVKTSNRFFRCPKYTAARLFVSVARALVHFLIIRLPVLSLLSLWLSLIANLNLRHSALKRMAFPMP